MKTVKPFGRGLAHGPLRVSLFDRNPGVARALADAFREVAGVEVLEGELLGLESDAIVSPANSFGDLDGGIDTEIDRSFKGKAQGAVLDLIAGRFRGELPVGLASIIGLSPGRFRFLVVAPTMRVPGDDLGATINASLAMRAAFAAILDHNEGADQRIESVAVPGLGTGVGGMSPEDSALQMRAAYDMIVAGGWKNILHPAQAPFVESDRDLVQHPDASGDQAWEFLVHVGSSREDPGIH